MHGALATLMRKAQLQLGRRWQIDRSKAQPRGKAFACGDGLVSGDREEDEERHDSSPHATIRAVFSFKLGLVWFFKVAITSNILISI